MFHRSVHSLVALLAIGACSSDSGSKGPTYGAGHPRIYLGMMKTKLTTALATAPGQRFQKMVDQWIGGDDIYAFPAWYAALAGQLSGDAKYCTAAAKMVDTNVVAEEAKISGGSAPDVAGDDYLAIGDTIGDLALVYDWCGPQIPAGRSKAWLAYANQAVFNVWNPDQAKWGDKMMSWAGWAIDDPSDNYYYSFLRATMLLGLAEKGDDPMGDTWIMQFRDTKIIGELDPKFDSDLVGGGSREGTGYGVAMRRLFELYDIWHESTGEDLATKTVQTRASMLSFIHQTLPTLDRVAPTGDQSRDSTASFFDYHRNYLQELITLFSSDPLAPRAQALLAGSSVPEMGQQFMYGYDFLYANAGVAASTLDGMGTAYYAPGIGEVYARSGWDTHATWMNLIAGPYTESHAHQDQGSLMIYKDGWLAYDAVIDSHSGLRQEVDAHGALRFANGGTTVEQKSGNTSQLLALHKGTGYMHVAADMTPVYGGGSGVTKVQREIVYLEPSCIVVYDRASSSADQVWSLAFPQMPSIAGTETQMMASGHNLVIQRVTPTTGVTSTVHDYTADSDFSAGFRLDEALPAGDQRWLHVIWIDDAVGSVVAHDANTVDITLSGGTTARVGFNPDAIGGTLTLGSTTVTLGAGVDKLPE